MTDLIPESRRGEGMGWFGMAMTLAMAAGPMLGVWVLENGLFHAIFWAGAGLSAAAFLIVFPVRVPFKPKEGSRKIEIFDKSVLPVSLSVFFLAVAYGGITTFLPLFSESIRINPGTFFLVYAIALTLARPIAGKLSDRIGQGYVVVPALIITISALIILSLSNGLLPVVIAAALYGIGFGSAQPALQVLNLRLVPADKRGVANAAFMTAFDLGIGLGSIVLGWVSQLTGYSMLFGVCAVSVAVSALVFMIMHSNLQRRKGQLG